MKPHWIWRPFGGISFLLDRKTVLIIAVLLLMMLITMITAAGLGEYKLSPAGVWNTLIGNGSEEETLVLYTLRLPRIIVSVLVGASLAVAGAILQGLVRNPLASPDIVGITGGASVAAVTFITFFSESISIRWLPLATLVGAGLVSLLIYALAWQRGVTPVRLVLIGIGIAAAMSALTTLMLVTSSIYSASQAYVWLTGSIYGTSWENVATILPWFIVFLPLAVLFARSVNVQQLGDDIATGVGNPLERHRLLLLMISVALAGSAVAVAGAIGFVGLIAPHMARSLVGASFGGVLPVSAVIGALLVLIADTVARTLFLPLDIPAGVFTAGVGAPFFIYLLYRNRNQ